MNDTYKTICDKCNKKTWYETEQPCKMSYTRGCENCGSHEFVSHERKCTGTLRVISSENLDPRLTHYYERGERVEVIEKDGTKNRFWVGKSTGWKPCYLEIKKRNSYGGEMAYIPEDGKIRGLGIYK